MCWVTFFALCFVIFLILSLCSETSCSWCRFIKCCREPVAREAQFRGTSNIANKIVNLNQSQEFPCWHSAAASCEAGGGGSCSTDVINNGCNHHCMMGRCSSHMDHQPLHGTMDNCANNSNNCRGLDGGCQRTRSQIEVHEEVRLDRGHRPSQHGSKRIPLGDGRNQSLRRE